MATFTEIETRWSLTDLVDCHEMLDRRSEKRTDILEAIAGVFGGGNGPKG